MAEKFKDQGGAAAIVPALSLHPLQSLLHQFGGDAGSLAVGSDSDHCQNAHYC
jgi:hypothetical protein